MEKVRTQIVLAVGLCLIILCLGVRCPEALGAEITLRFAGNLPITHYISREQELYAKLIMERTKGKVKVEVYPAGQLFSDKDLQRALPSGAVDMAAVSLALWGSMVPLAMFADFPVYYNDIIHWRRVMDSDAGEILKQELEKTDVKFLYWMDFGQSGLFSRVPLRTLEDFKGKKIRGTGEVFLEAIKTLGATPTFLGGGEVYMALQKGIIDGGMTGVSSIWERKFFEVAKYISPPDFSYAMFFVAINTKKWDSLPKDVQAAMMEAAKVAHDWGRKESEKSDKEAIEKCAAKGMEVYYLPAKERERWRAASKGMIDYFLKRAGDEKGKMILEKIEKLR